MQEAIGGSHVGQRASVRDVARLAGVSTQTVSRVLNDSPQLREETRAKVLEAMAQLDYRPNNAARSLGTSTTRTLGVLATDVTLFGPNLAIAELAVAARAAGKWVATAYADAHDDESVHRAVAHVLGQGVDGLVLVAPHVRSRDVLTERVRNLPVVVMHGGAEDLQAMAAAMVVDHLANLGHHRIARVGGPPDWLEEASRATGHASALQAHGLRPGPIWGGDWSAHSGAALAGDVAVALESPDPPTAIAVANDQMALGLIHGLSDLGIDVPGDVSIAGFDDNPDSAFYRPSLTTVRLDVSGEARRCVAAVFAPDAITNPERPHLVSRASTAPPS